GPRSEPATTEKAATCGSARKSCRSVIESAIRLTVGASADNNPRLVDGAPDVRVPSTRPVPPRQGSLDVSHGAVSGRSSSPSLYQDWGMSTSGQSGSSTLVLHIGHDELVVRRRYEVASILNDA